MTVFDLFAQFVDEDRCIFGVVDGDGDEVDAAGLEGFVERGLERLHRLDPAAPGPVGLGVLHEVAVLERHPEVQELVHRLFPAD